MIIYKKEYFYTRFKSQPFLFWSHISSSLIILLLISSCDNISPHSIESKRTLVVGTDATLIPMSFIDDQGNISGFETDIIKALAQDANLSIQLRNVEWAGLFGGLLTKKLDAVISSVTILEERKKKMAFSIPYLKSGLALVVRKNMYEINSLNDIKMKNLRVGAQLGTTAYFLLDKDPQIQKKGYQQYGHAVSDLIKGEIDVVIGESTGTLYYKKNEATLFEKIKMAGEIITDEFYGIVLRKEDKGLLKTINISLTHLRENGTLQRLHDKWELGNTSSIPK